MNYKLPVTPGDAWDLNYLLERELVSPFVALLGARGEIPRAGAARLWIDVREALYQAEGLVQGGVIYSLADAAAALALHSSTRPAQKIATIEAKINYLAPVFEGVLTASARVEHQGRTTAVAQCEVTNTAPQRERRVALMICTFAILADREA